MMPNATRNSIASVVTKPDCSTWGSFRARSAGSIFYIMHHIIVKTNLFLISGVANHFRGTYQLKKLGGLYRAYPGLAVLFLIPALSLAGVPPLSGFFAKLALLQAGLATEQYAIVAAALGVSLLTLISMTKIWSEAFWKPAAAPAIDPPAAGTGTPHAESPSRRQAGQWPVRQRVSKKPPTRSWSWKSK